MIAPPKTGDDEERPDDFLTADRDERRDTYRERTGVRMQMSGMIPANGSNYKGGKGGKKAGGKSGKGGKKGC